MRKKKGKETVREEGKEEDNAIGYAEK